MLPSKSLDIAKKHAAPLLLALAGAQVTAQAYMAVRSSLPKVPPYSKHLAILLRAYPLCLWGSLHTQICHARMSPLDVSAAVLRGPIDS